MIRPALILAFVGGVALVSAQAPVDSPRFEVASVRPNTSDDPPSMNVPPRGSVVITNVPLQNVIVNAHGLPAFRIVDAPDWIGRERFDITAKAPDDAAPGQARLMMQALLADRFALRVRREIREQQIYALVVAHDDGRFGPDLKRSTADCSTGNTPSPLSATPESPCGALFGVGPTGGTIVSNGQPLTRVVSALSMAVRRSVVDRTGLNGAFDVRLRWSDDVNVGAGSNDTPSIFTALQEQLGLRLEPSRGPVEVLVIDSVERPAPD
jgi:uncharacterized protein (TIGR03435 family)